jgi:hypothetical protein
MMSAPAKKSRVVFTTAAGSATAATGEVDMPAARSVEKRHGKKR